MRWISRLLRFRLRRLCVVGLDVGPAACRVVVLAGTPQQPDALRGVAQLDLPPGCVLQGVIRQPEVLGQCLRNYLQAGDHQPDALYVGIDNAGVLSHAISLVAGLSPDDVVFQLQAELQLLRSPNEAEVWMDYSPDVGSAPDDQQRYWVQAVARTQIEAVQHMAQMAGLIPLAVEPRSDAAQRAEKTRADLTVLPHARDAWALPSDEAFGLALRAWCDAGCNFLPRRITMSHLLRRAWGLTLAVCAFGGAVLASGLAMVMTSAIESQQPRREEVEASARIHDKAKQAHAQAKAAVDHDAAQAHWLAQRQRLQLQSLHWSRVLGQDAQGVWVASVTQDGARWTLQGEALSAQHAHQLQQHLQALDIWSRAPEIQQLRLKSETTAAWLPVWQFRMEADLKVGM